MTGLARLRVDGNRRGRFGMALLAGAAVAAIAVTGCSADTAEESLADSGRFAEGADPRATELTTQVSAEIKKLGLPPEWALLATAPTSGTPASAAYDEAVSQYGPAVLVKGSASPAPAGSAAPAGTEILLGVDGVDNATQSLVAATSWLSAAVADCSGIDAQAPQPLTAGTGVDFTASPADGAEAGAGGSAICGQVGSALDGSQFTGYFSLATPDAGENVLFGYCLPPNSCTQVLPGANAAAMPEKGKEIPVGGEQGYSLNQVVVYVGSVGDGAAEAISAARLPNNTDGSTRTQVWLTTPENIQKGVDGVNRLFKQIFGVDEDAMVIQEFAPTQ